MALVAYEAYESGEVSVSADGRTSYTRVFVVDADDIISGAQALDADGLPRHGDPYFSEVGDPDPTAICETLTATPDPQDRTTWRVRATYSTQLPAEVANETGVSGPGGAGNAVGSLVGGPTDPTSPAAGGGGGSGGGGPGSESMAPPSIVENPLMRPAKWSLRPRFYTKIPEKDRDNVRVLNSASDKFDPPVEVEYPAATLIVLKNLPLDRITLDSYTDWLWAVNSEPWLGKPEKTWRVADLEVDPTYEAGAWFFATKWVFEYNRDGWDPMRVLDAGWNEKDLTNGGFKAIVDQSLRQPNAVPLLDGAGSALGPDADPEYKTFRFRLAMRFQIFGLFGEVE